MLQEDREPLREFAPLGRSVTGIAVPEVDLVINVFERTYRRLTDPDFFARLVRSHRFPFARRVLLVNNVADPSDARLRAARLLRAGAIDEVHFVADRLERALALCGLQRADLEPLLHFCDAPLVAITLAGSPWMVYWDAEASLDREIDWVTPAWAQLSGDRRLLIANPSWECERADGSQPAVSHETDELRGEFAIGRGFSDQVFLARRADLARPIYRDRCLGTLLHPRAHKVATFEARVNAHMRHHARLRATYLGASYSIDQPVGSSPCAPTGMLEWGRYIRNAAVLRTLRRTPWRPSCVRRTWLDGPDPLRSRPPRDASAEPRASLHTLGRRVAAEGNILSEQHAQQRDDLLAV